MIFKILNYLKNILILFSLIFQFSFYGAIYYVTPNGNDSNPGAYSFPWLTWQKAFDVAGDIIYLKGGVYYTSGLSCGNVITVVNITNKNGTSSNRIIIQSYQDEVINCLKL